MSAGQEHIARNIFGGVAFAVATAVIGFVLSPFVPESKEAIANIILGNVLGWPLMVLAYHYGSSSGSRAKDATIATAAANDGPLDLAGSEAP